MIHRAGHPAFGVDRPGAAKAKIEELYPLLNAEQVARFLGVSESQVRHMTCRSELAWVQLSPNRIASSRIFQPFACSNYSSLFMRRGQERYETATSAWLNERRGGLGGALSVTTPTPNNSHGRWFGSATV
jgi:hypothetical protein